MAELTEILKDAGCGPERIAEICRFYERGDLQEVVRKLKLHRRSLMEKLHAEQAKVYSLDLLLRKFAQTLK